MQVLGYILCKSLVLEEINKLSKNSMGVENSSEKRPKRNSYILLDRLFSNDGISYVYFFLVVILMFNLGIGLYFCGRNFNRESELVSSSIFDINIPKGSKDKNVNNSNYVPRDETSTQTRPEHAQKKTTTTTTTTTAAAAAVTHKSGTSSHGVQTPGANSLPTCLYLNRFPTKYDLNGLLFWNVSSDMYLYWGYKNKTGSIYLLGNSHHMESALQPEEESSGRAVQQGGDQPKMVEFKESKAGSGTRVQRANTGGLVAVGEKNLPPYWYMNWVEQSKTGSRERFKPAFLPCLGSLFTYSNKDLLGFFQELGVVYVCGFRSYTREKDLIELMSTPFVKVSPDGVGKLKQVDFTTRRSACTNSVKLLAVNSGE